MRKFLGISALLLIVSTSTFAGGLLTNTNQNVAFLRMVARGASIGIDGVYSNPAGLAFLPNDGFYLSLNGQSAYQTRVIDATFPLFSEENHTRRYKGTASAPIIPSFQAAYKTGDWTISGSFAITGGGGKASFDEGVPLFTTAAMGLLGQAGLTPDKYSITSAMDGKQYIYGLQLGLTYKINDWLSVFGGGRMNYFTGGYEGFLDAKSNQGDVQLAKIALNCKQTGWGITPIIGVDAKLGKWNFAAKYEFRANMNIENKTSQLEANPASAGALLAPYADGVNTPNDIPAFLSVAAGYEILPTLRASVEYHFFDDKAAGMAGGKEKSLTHGTHEYLAGVEWDITKMLTVSGGYQRTNYGLSDDFQSDISFSCDSYSLGFGAAVRITPRLNLNVAYFWTNYDDYTKKLSAASQNVYSRTNKVFGLGVDYRF